MLDEQLKILWAYRRLGRENEIKIEEIRQRTIGRETNTHLLRQCNFELSSLAEQNCNALRDYRDSMEINNA